MTALSSRPEEEWAREQLDAHLRALIPAAQLEWSAGSEPPDFFLQIGATRFAIEVSAMVDFIGAGKSTLPEPTYYRSTQKLVKDIEAEALARGVLKGLYVIWFDGALPEPRRDARCIRAGALAYITETQTGRRADQIDLLPDAAGLVSIKKVGDSAPLVSGGWNGDAKWESQIINNSHRKLGEKMDEKARKLAALTDPRILLVENALSLGPAVPNAFATYDMPVGHSTFFDGVFVLSRNAPIVEAHVGGALARTLGR
ncbi:MAG: hypothetical protein DCC71_19655 [Proteobacteria bacterium]|nr:MAG: hypothetical protein DCC71_19655 [Pseudomonadota bacterium]